MARRNAIALFESPSASTSSTSSSRGVSASYSSGSTLANRHLHVLAAVTANNSNGNALSNAIFGQQVEQVFRILHRQSVEFHDAVAYAKAGDCGGAVIFHVDDQQCTLILAESHRLTGNTQIASADAAVFEQSRGGFPRDRGGNDDAEAADRCGCRDADYPSRHVD